MSRLIAALQRVVRRAPIALIVATVVLTGVFGAVSTQAVDEAGFENFAPENEVTEALERIADEFGSGIDPVQLVVTSEGGPLLDAEGLAAAVGLRERLRSDDTIAEVMASIPGDAAVATYADAVIQAATAQGLDPRSLDDAAITELQRQAVAQLPRPQAAEATQLLGGDDDGTEAEVGAVLVLLDGSEEAERREEAVAALPGVADDLDGVEVSTVDFRVLGDQVNESVQSDLSRLLGIAFGLIILLLVVIYRRPMDVLASLFGLVFTIVWMQGISVLLGPGYLGLTGGMSEMSMAIPILLVGLGVDYGIHLTMRYREERAGGNDVTSSATGAIGAVGAALALATITTVVGFMTNLTNPLPPLQDFGVFAAVGVAAAFLIMTTFVPAVRLAVDQARQRRGRLSQEIADGDDRPGFLGRLAASLAPAATHRPWTVIGVAGVLTLIGAGSATNLSTEFSQTEFFPDDSEALATLDLVQEAFGGDLTERTQVLISGDVTDTGVLAALSHFEQDAAEVAGVRTTEGRAETDSILRRVEEVLALTQDQSAGRVTPPATGPSTAEPPADDAAPPAASGPAADPEALAELVEVAQSAGVGTADGIEPSAELAPLAEALMAVDPTAGSVISLPDDLLITVSTQAGEEIDELRSGLTEAAAELEALGLEVVVASDPILVADVMDELRESQISGLITTLVASMLILALAFWVRVREPMLGVLAIGAVALVVAWVLGLMAAVGIPFNVMTAMVSALAIGIGVPFGIHVVNRFLEDRGRFSDRGDALRSTLRHTGGALVGSAVTTIAGFGSLALSAVPPFRQFGAVTAMTIGFALLSSVIVLPAMLSVYERRRTRSRSAEAEVSPGSTWSSAQPPTTSREPVG